MSERDMDIDERNAGAIGMAQQLLGDDGQGTMGPGPCADAQAEWRRMKSALSTAERERDDAIWSAYRHGYLEGTAYKPPEGSKDTYETLSAVADAKASQHVKLRARVPSGGEEGRSHE